MLLIINQKEIQEILSEEKSHNKNTKLTIKLSSKNLQIKIKNDTEEEPRDSSNSNDVFVTVESFGSMGLEDKGNCAKLKLR